MRSGTRVFTAAVTAALLSIPLFAGAGSAPYNPGGAPGAVPQNARQDWSYFCTAGYHSSDNTFFLTGVHHLGTYNAAGPQRIPLMEAWRQTMKQRDPKLLTDCALDRTAQIQERRQQILANQSLHIVNVDWEYGQAVRPVTPD